MSSNLRFLIRVPEMLALVFVMMAIGPCFKDTVSNVLFICVNIQESPARCGREAYLHGSGSAGLRKVGGEEAGEWRSPWQSRLFGVQKSSLAMSGLDELVFSVSQLGLKA